MNMVEATISTANGSAHVEFGGQRLGVPPEVLASHAGLRAFEGGSVVVGLRPEDIEDASLVPEAPQDRRSARSSTCGSPSALMSSSISPWTRRPW